MRVPTTAALALASIGALLVLPGPARAEAADPHAHCHPEAAAPRAMKRAAVTTARYALPDVPLVRDDGQAVSLLAELDDGRPVALNFVFTSCTTICPVMSQTFARLQAKLVENRGRVHLISISIDPEQDTPERLAAYARKFGAGPGWRHYTGTSAASVAIQRAFDAYRGDKMNHTPLTFLRAAPGRPWVRVDGFASPDDLAAELRELIASR